MFQKTTGCANDVADHFYGTYLEQFFVSQMYPVEEIETIHVMFSAVALSKISLKNINLADMSWNLIMIKMH